MKKVIPELSNFSGVELEEKFGEMKEALNYLSVIAKKWQNSRQKEGALNLESTEVQFEFEEKNMKDLKPKEHLEIHETVAECMIMANHWVARKISQTFSTNSILRLHPPPKKDKFEAEILMGFSGIKSLPKSIMGAKCKCILFQITFITVSIFFSECLIRK